jgi:type VI secretion system Hcp family effector
MASLEGDITIKGMKQGAFQGQNPVKSRAGSTVVTAVSNEIITPSDGNTGLSTGKRRYGAYIVTMAIDKSVINHQVAISTNEVLSTVSIRLYQLAGGTLNQAAGAGGAGGESKPYYTILLESAVLTQFEIVYSDVRSQDPFIKNRDPFMRAHFTFQKVTGTWVDGGVTFTDDWLSVT